MYFQWRFFLSLAIPHQVLPPAFLLHLPYRGPSHSSICFLITSTWPMVRARVGNRSLFPFHCPAGRLGPRAPRASAQEQGCRQPWMSLWAWKLKLAARSQLAQGPPVSPRGKAQLLIAGGCLCLLPARKGLIKNRGWRGSGAESSGNISCHFQTQAGGDSRPPPLKQGLPAALGLCYLHQHLGQPRLHPSETHSLILLSPTLTLSVTHASTHVLILTLSHTHSHLLSHGCTYFHPLIHTHTLTHSHMQTHSHTPTLTYSHTYSHTLSHTYSLTCSHTHTLIVTLTHMLTHTLTLTHSHTYSHCHMLTLKHPHTHPHSLSHSHSLSDSLQTACPRPLATPRTRCWPPPLHLFKGGWHSKCQVAHPAGPRRAQGLHPWSFSSWHRNQQELWCPA